MVIEMIISTSLNLSISMTSMEKGKKTTLQKNEKKGIFLLTGMVFLFNFDLLVWVGADLLVPLSNPDVCSLGLWTGHA